MSTFPYNNLKISLETIWSYFESATEHKGYDFRLGFLGSVTKDDSPAVRTVVLRHFFRKKQELIIYTDERSDKVPQFKATPKAELLFYDWDRKIQVRCLCDIRLLSYQEFVGETSITPDIEGVKDFMTDKGPGEVIEKDDYKICENPKDNFMAICAQIRRLEWLCLLNERNYRAMYSWDEKGERTQETYLVP